MESGENLATVITKRHAFVEALLDRPHGKAELVDATGTSRSTVDRAIAELEDHGLVVRTGGEYEPTFTGKLVLESFRDYRYRLDEIGRAHEVVADLSLDTGLPAEALEDATVTPSEPHAFGYPVKGTLELIRGTDRLRGVVSAITPQYVDAIYEAVTEDGLALDLVLTAEVCETITDAHRAEFQALVDAEAATLYRTDRSADCAVWSVVDDGETTSCLVVYTDTGVEGVVVNDAASMNEWATGVYEEYRADASALEQFPPASV